MADASPKRIDAVIVVPPFAALDCPSLAAHLLQACASARGFEVRVFYANLRWASILGEEAYTELVRSAPGSDLAGERLFRNAAFGLDAPGPDDFEAFRRSVPRGRSTALTPEAYLGSSRRVPEWIDDVARTVLAGNPRVVGCTNTFEQSLASIAILNRVKALRPDVITVMGGCNAQGQMAEGIGTLETRVDHIFSGESEQTFVEFLSNVRNGVALAERIVPGQPCMNMDALPSPLYDEFFEQRRSAGPHSRIPDEALWIHCESSRGCWWGEKHQCTFCGFNGLTMQFRRRNADRVIEELKSFSRYPTRRVLMTDNIMPHEYFRTLLPRLPEEVPGLSIYYELKANLSLEKCRILRQAGITSIQPGIEALSTSLLKRMDKGVTAAQNIALLRYARALDLKVHWNTLYDFPGDRASDYEETVALVRLIHHLMPPVGCHAITLDRYSPYFDHPERYGVTNVRPLRGYGRCYPADADLGRIAYHFEGDYASAARTDPELATSLKAEIARWQAEWSRGEPAAPVLLVRQLTESVYVLVDRRGLARAEETEFLSREEACALLVAGPLPLDDFRSQAVERGLAVQLDGQFVPLAVAAPALIATFESEVRANAQFSQAALVHPLDPLSTSAPKGTPALSSVVE